MASNPFQAYIDILMKQRKKKEQESAAAAKKDKTAPKDPKALAPKNQNAQPAPVSSAAAAIKPPTSLEKQATLTKPVNIASMNRQDPGIEHNTKPKQVWSGGAFEPIRDPFKERKPDVQSFYDPEIKRSKTYDKMDMSDVFALFYQLPREVRQSAFDQFDADYMKKRSSPFYYPYYAKGTNNEANAKLWGTSDLESIVKDPANLAYLDYLDQNRSGETPKAPTKKSSINYQKGYSLFYMLQDYKDEQAARSELPTLYKTVGDLAVAYPEASEQEILGMIDWDTAGENGGKAFKTIVDYREAAFENYMEKYTLGGGLYVGDASLVGVIRAARRGEDVSDASKDYLALDGYKKVFDMMLPEYQKENPDLFKPKEEPKKDPGFWGSLFDNASKNMDAVFGDKAKRTYASLGDKSLKSVAGAVREMDVFGDKQRDPLEQSVQKTGMIDLRDGSITEDQWPFLIEAGLASQAQADAILASRNVQASPEYTGMVPGAALPQASSMPRSGQDMKALVAYKATLQQQRGQLVRAEEDRNVKLPAIEAEIAKLENDQQFVDDPTEINAKLQDLYAQRAEMSGSSDDEAKRKSAIIAIENELDNVDIGMNELRNAMVAKKKSEVPPRQHPQTAPGETAHGGGGSKVEFGASKDAGAATSAPKETSDQRNARLLSVNIDDLSEEVGVIDMLGRDALDKYNTYTQVIQELDGQVGGIDAEVALSDPILAASYNARVEAVLDRQKIINDMAAMGVDITNGAQFKADVARKKQEVLDAVVLQSSAMSVSATDFPTYSAKGMTLSNPEPDMGGFMRGSTILQPGVKNPATYAKDNALEIGAALAFSTGYKPGELVRLERMAFMEDREVEIYSYLLANPAYGRKRADMYVDGLMPYLEARKGLRTSNALSDLYGPGGLIGYGLLAGAQRAAQGLKQWGSEGPVPYSAGEYAGMYARQKLEENGPKAPDWMGGGSLGQLAYDTMDTSGNMLFAVAANAFVPTIGGPVMIFAGSSGNSFRQSLMDGHNEDEAFKKAAVTGVFEALLEKWLGAGVTGGRTALNKLGDMVGARRATAMIGAFGDGLLGILGSGISNFSEEYLQDAVVAPLADSFAYGEEFKGIDWTDPQSVRSGMMGFAMGAVGDAPEVFGNIAEMKQFGFEFTDPAMMDVLIAAGKKAPAGSVARQDTEDAELRMDESERMLDPYRAGKLADSVGPKLFKGVLQPSVAAYDKTANSQNAPVAEESPATIEGNRPPDAKPESPMEDIELDPEEIAQADGNARRAAYETSMNRKAYPPDLERLTVRCEYLDKQMYDVLRAELTAKNKVDDLKRDTNKTLEAATAGAISLDVALKKIAKNAEESAAARTEADAYFAQRAALSDEWSEAQAARSEAKGKLYQYAYIAELNNQLAAQKQAKADKQAAADAAALEEADRQAGAARVAEIDTEDTDLANQEAAMSQGENSLKRAMQQALDNENDALNSVDNGGGQAAVEAAEMASEKSRAARSRYDAAVKQREAVTKKRQALAKERADLTAKISTASAGVKADQLAQPDAPAPEPAPAPAPAPAKPGAPAQPGAQPDTQEKPKPENPLDRLKGLLGRDFPVTKVNPADLIVDPQTYQFKSGSDSSGVTTPMTGDFKPAFAENVVVHKRLDGKLYVADGHHRREFAIRKGVPSLNAIVLDEADGFSVADARAFAAARNISQRSGSTIDAAKVFRAIGVSAADLADLGLTAKEKTVERAAALASLTDEYWKRVVSGNISESTGYVMGKYFPNDGKYQAKFMSMLQGRKLSEDAQLELGALLENATKREEGVTGEEGQFAFGFMEEFETNAVQMAQIAANTKKKLRKRKNLFKSLSDDVKRQAIESVGQNRIDAEANQDVTDNASLADFLMEGYMYKGPVHDMIDGLATSLADGEVTLSDATDKMAAFVLERAAEKGLNGNEPTEAIAGTDTKANDDNTRANPSDAKSGRGGRKDKGEGEQKPKTGAVKKYVVGVAAKSAKGGFERGGIVDTIDEAIDSLVDASVSAGYMLRAKRDHMKEAAEEWSDGFRAGSKNSVYYAIKQSEDGKYRWEISATPGVMDRVRGEHPDGFEIDKSGYEKTRDKAVAAIIKTLKSVDADAYADRGSIEESLDRSGGFVDFDLVDADGAYIVVYELPDGRYYWRAALTETGIRLRNPEQSRRAGEAIRRMTEGMGKSDALQASAVRRRSAAPVASKQKLQRVSEIAKPLYEAFGVKYTTKNKPAILNKIAVGLHEKHSGVVITRTMQNIDAYAHELGHALFANAGVVSRTTGAIDQKYDAAVQGMVANLPGSFKQLYKPSEWQSEALAEFMRAYLSDRNAAVAFAGDAFVRQFEQEILTAPQLKAARKAREDFALAIAADDVDTYQARLVSRADEKRHKGGWGSFVQGVADRYYAVLKFDIAAKKKGYDNSDLSKRAYLAMSNLPYSRTQASNITERFLMSPDKRIIGRSFAEVINPISLDKMKKFNAYITAMHDIDRQRAGLPLMGDYTELDSMRVAVQLAQENPEFEKVHTELIDWWDRFLDEWVVKPNAIDDAAARVKKMKDKYPSYVPGFRSNNDRVDVMVEEFGDMGGVLGQASVHFKHAKGGDSAIFMPVESFVIRINEIVVATNKVLAMRKLHEVVQATPGMGDWMKEIPNTFKNGQDQALKIIDAAGNVRYYQVFDRLLYDSLLKTTTKEDKKFWQMVGATTGMFKQLTTVSNPKFAFKNAPRDFFEAYVKGSNQNPFTFTAQWAKAIYELSRSMVGKNSDMVKLYYASGGGDSSISPTDRMSVAVMERTLYSKPFVSSLRRIVNGDGFKDRARGGVDSLHYVGAKLKEFINAFNNVVEGSQRFAEFSRTYKRTGNAAASFYASTNVTTDFRRSGNGTAIHLSGLIFAFQNAGIQGTYSWYRMAKEAQLEGNGKAFAKKAGATFAMKAIKAAMMFAMVPLAEHMLLSMMGGEDKKAYDLMAANVKEDNIIIPKFWNQDRGVGSDRFIILPKPKGPVPAMGDAIGRSLLEAMQKDGSWEAFASYGLGDFLEDKKDNIVDSVNPFGSPVFAPIVQIMYNRTWYDTPLESQWMVDQNIALVNRVKDTTSSVAIYIANLPGLRNKVSPIQVDYFLNQSLGIVGDIVTDDFAIKSIKPSMTTDATVASDITSSMYDMYGIMGGIAADYEQTGENSDQYARLNRSLTDAERHAAVVEAKAMTKKGGVLYIAKSRTSKHYDEIDAIMAGDKPDSEKLIEVRKIKLLMIEENADAVRKAEDYMRKYVLGTPPLFKKFYGK